MRFPLLAALLGSTCIVPAYAQEAVADPQPTAGAQTTDAAADEIVVTAQRRSERVQDVPIAISVVSGDQLQRQQVTQLTDLSRTTTALQFGAVSGGGGSGAFVRGIGTAALSRSAEGAVGIVVDGVVQGNTNISNLFDIARVEVLRGPQGTLFGQSVSAGVINISTLAPDPTAVSGRIIVEASGDGFAGSELGRQIVRGGVNVPVSATSAVRFSAFGGQTTGTNRNLFTGKTDELTEAGWRARFLGTFADRVTVNLIADYSYNSTQDPPFFNYVQAATPDTIALARSCGITIQRGNLDSCGRPGRATGRAYGLSGQVDVELGDLTLTSITARRIQNLYTSTDIDRFYNSAVNISSGAATDYGQFTQEIRLSSDPARPLSVVLGGFYYDADTDVEQGPPQGGQVALPNGFILGTLERSTTQSRNYSGFGEARYRNGPVTVFGGVRLQRSELSHVGLRQSVTVRGPIPNGTPLTTDYGYDDTDLSWRVGGQLAPTRQFMVYGTVARGYKNAQLASIAVVNNVPLLRNVVLPEKPMAYEVGVKTSLFNGRLSFNIDGFYQKVRNLQTQTTVTLSDNPVPALLPTNVSEVVSKGIEADAFGRIGRHLTLNASAIYNVAKYPIDYRDRDNVSLVGQQLAFAPRFTATLSGEYTTPVSGNVEGFLSLDGRYKSATRLTDEVRDPTYSVDEARFIFGGRVGARVDDQWSVALFANNIGASRLPAAATRLLGNFAYAYNIQSVRQVGLQTSLQF